MKSLHLIHQLCCLAAIVACSEVRQESKPSSLLPMPEPIGQSLFIKWVEEPQTVECPTPDAGDTTHEIHTFEVTKSTDANSADAISLKDKDSNEVHHMTWQSYKCFAAWGDQTLMLCPDLTEHSFFLRVTDGYTDDGDLNIVCQTNVNFGVGQ